MNFNMMSLLEIKSTEVLPMTQSQPRNRRNELKLKVWTKYKYCELNKNNDIYINKRCVFIY